MIKKIFYFGCVLFFTACQPIGKAIVGMKSPKEETKESVEHWVEKNIKSQTAVQIFTVTPEAAIKRRAFLSTEPMIINTQAKMVLYKGCTSKECIKNLGMYFKTVTPTQLQNLESDTNFTNVYKYKSGIFSTTGKLIEVVEQQVPLYFFSATRSVMGEPVDSTQYLHKQTLVLPFAIFLGNKLQVKDINNWIAAAQKNTSVNWNIVLLNIDKQSWWGNEWNSKITYSVGKFKKMSK
jgi:hypothetical protein